MTKWLLPLAAVAAACTSSAQATGELRARVAPTPTVVTTASWSPTIALKRDGKPTTARLALTIRKGKVSRGFMPRAQRRGVYRVRVVFPSSGRWSWRLAAGSRSLARGAMSVSASLRFELPYDLALLPDGAI